MSLFGVKTAEELSYSTDAWPLSRVHYGALKCLSLGVLGKHRVRSRTLWPLDIY